MTTSEIPFDERGGALRGCLDLVAGRFPRFLLGGAVPAGLLPVFHFHDVSRGELQPKLEFLADNGYRTVRADDIAAHAARQTTLPPSSVALCFDDAWASLWTVAAPLLREYNLTAITYAIPARIEDAAGCRATIADHTGPAWDGPPLVTWPELRELHTSGLVDVQSHTYSHSMIFHSTMVGGFVTPSYAATPLLNRPQLSAQPMRFVTSADLGAPLYPARSRMSAARRVLVSVDAHDRCVRHVAESGGAAFFGRPGWQEELARIADSARATERESESAQTRAIEEELDRSRVILNERLRTQSIRHICLPWGVSSDQTAAALVRVGYRSAFANRLRGLHAVRPGDDLHWLKRLPNKYIFRLPGRGRRLWG
ncbi:MAG: polysaccharide deacetylase family protein [Acidobacteria bacterium]|nr:polysaccharide deacetylase family protein [Acidobacteriota bacterium]